MRFSRKATIAATALLVAGLGAALAACFSERGTTGPSDFECEVPIPSEIAGNTIVFIRDYAFVPEVVRVKAGTRVSWINCGPADTHTATSNTGVWDSGPLPAGAHYTRTFSQTGTFPYFCIPHPFMTASIIVES